LNIQIQDERLELFRQEWLKNSLTINLLTQLNQEEIKLRKNLFAASRLNNAHCISIIITELELLDNLKEFIYGRRTKSIAGTN